MEGKTRLLWYAAGGGLLAAVVLWWLFRGQRQEFAEVTGVMTLDGRPLESVEVRFLPDAEQGTVGPVSSCYTDAHGRYTMRCDRNSRAETLIGVHRVVVFDISALPAPSAHRGAADDSGTAP